MREVPGKTEEKIQYILANETIMGSPMSLSLCAVSSLLLFSPLKKRAKKMNFRILPGDRFLYVLD